MWILWDTYSKCKGNYLQPGPGLGLKFEIQSATVASEPSQ